MTKDTILYLYSFFAVYRNFVFEDQNLMIRDRRENMKRVLKQSICLLAILCIIAGLAPMKAQAYEKKGDYRIHSMSENSWKTIPDDDTDYYDVYRFKINSDGYIKVKVNNDNVTTRRPSRAAVRLYSTYKVGADNSEDYFIASFYSGEHYLAIKAGTYYFYASADLLKFKYQHTEVSHGSNYCMHQAKKVSSGKNMREVFAYGREYTKWYKITLTKKQKIKTFVKRMECTSSGHGKVYGPGIDHYIVNSKGLKVKTTKLNAHQLITGKLPKGTYYICVTRNIPTDEDEYYGDRLISLTVKKQ